MYRVLKRDGSEAEFDISKIINAIRKAFEACDRQYHPGIIDMIAIRVTSDYEPKIKNDVIGVEEIQDSVEKVLSEAGYSDVAKAYILYRKQRENIRNIQATTLDYKNIVDGYLQGLAGEGTEGLAQPYSVGGLILSNSSAITANYWLGEAFDKEISEAHRAGDIHIHDLNMLAGYSAGWSILQLIREGLTGIPGRVSRGPAKHLSTLISQMVNFLGIMQNEWAGAQSFSGFDTYLAPYVRSDGLSFDQVKQAVQSFVYEINTASRWGTQAPFICITMDWNVPEDLKDQPAVIAGNEADFTYGECQKEMDLINRAFIEVMLEGDWSSDRFRYPIPTYCITDDFEWNESENSRLLFELTAKYGIPYFANYCSSSLKPEDIRKTGPFDPAVLQNKAGGYFGSGEHTGSIGVITINLPRIAYLSENEDDFYRRLDRMTDIAARALKVKRDILTRLLEGGLYPYTKKYLGTFEHHFSTISMIGMNEACLNAAWLKKDLSDMDAVHFAESVMDHELQNLREIQALYGTPYNLEAAPAETTAGRLARLDKELYPQIITAGSEEVPYYTNSTQLPVSAESDLFSALDCQETLQSRYTGGTVFHVYLKERLNDWKEAQLLVRKIVSNYRIPYVTVSPVYSVCEEHGYLPGDVRICPKCGKKTAVYTRISGYYSAVSELNDSKAQEYSDLMPFTE